MPRLSLVLALMATLVVTGPAYPQAPPAPLVQVADTPPQKGAALVIAPPGGLCRELVTQFASVGGPRGDLRDRCTELVQGANKPSLAGAAGQAGRLSAFLNGSFSTGKLDATDREAGFDFDSGGVTAGVDYRLTPNLVLGVAFGYVRTSADFSQSGGKLDSDDFSG